MRLGLFGGSFDPIHRGHVDPILAACQQLALDRVLYLPTAHPPHKVGRSLAPAWARFAMVELALLDHPRLHTSTYEMERAPSYTFDTVSHFQALHADDQLFLIVGLDSFLALDRWSRGDQLAERIELAVMVRPGHALDPDALASPQRRALDAGRVHLVSNLPNPASATEIRRLVAAGEPPPADWLAPRVLKYAKKYRLYADPETR